MDSVDWTRVARNLDDQGSALLEGVLPFGECDAIAKLYAHDERFRSRVVMGSHGFGRGEYKYFAYPLPEVISSLRTFVYPRLVPIANHWNESMGIEVRFPDDHAEFIERCRQAGQTRPTPLLLQYGPGDYNCLHQDLYGEHVFPLQLAILLSKPDDDFEGGEFVMTEQRPRMQSRATVVPLRKGDGVLFAVHHRPVRGTRSTYRVNMRHGVSPIRAGRRHTVGIIFHDSKIEPSYSLKLGQTHFEDPVFRETPRKNLATETGHGNRDRPVFARFRTFVFAHFAHPFSRIFVETALLLTLPGWETGTDPIFGETRFLERKMVSIYFYCGCKFSTSMPRVSRFVLPDVVHHVVARGSNRQRIFASGFDKAKYLKRFSKVADEEKVLIHGYCLMDNHVHWLLTPTTHRGLARLFQRVHTWWAMVFNRKHDRVGHLFQSRYQSSALSESHYWFALRYVELNPKKARLVRQPAEWEFSSAHAHVTGEANPLIDLVPVITRKRFSARDWRDFLRTPDEFDISESLRTATRVNRPCGESSWIESLQRKYHRILKGRPPGRPGRSQTLAAG